jgi:outer membrane protein assembly factor BamB
MRLKHFSIILLLVVTSLFLGGCSGAGAMANNWPGITIDQDTVYVAYAGGVMAVRLSDGSLVWRFPEKVESGRTFYAAPAVSDGLLVVGDYAGTLHALDAASGVQKWAFTPQVKSGNAARFVGSALIHQDMILAPTAGHDSLYAVSLTGKELWRFPTGQAIWAQPVSDGERVYIASMDHYLYAVRLVDHQQVWKKDLGAALVAAPVLADGTLYLGTLGNEMIAVSTDGEILWRYTTDGAIWSSPVLVEGSLYFGDAAGSIYAVDVTSGTGRWKIDLSSGAITGSGAVVSGNLVFSSENGSLVAVGLDGRRLWTQTFQGKLYTGPAVSDDKIIVAITQGDQLLKALDSNGNELWSFAPPK